ncbi:MAG TPA: hypothetical protein VFG47_14540 [Geminicoccaceae bacterium]|nr:hypothetical protein [Geminicoccaceae bacterium]
MANISGTLDNDVLLGTPERDVIAALAGDDVVQAGAGNDTVNGGPGDDLLFGNRGIDALFGAGGDDGIVWDNGDGSDTIDGGPGRDTATVHGALVAGETFEVGPGGTGGVLFERTSANPFQLDIADVEVLEVQEFAGNGTLRVGDLLETPLRLVIFSGGAGNDTLDGSRATTGLVARGGEGADRLLGGAADDVFLGHTGGDLLRGGGGGDQLIGGVLDAGRDALRGGAGDDFLYPGPGDDQLTGGPGRDVVLIEPGDGNDRMTDFTSGQDVIALRDFEGAAGAPLTFADLEDSIGTDAQGNVVIDLAPFAPVPSTSNTLTLLGVADVAEADFALI